MSDNIDKEIARLDRKIKFAGLTDFPGVIALGIGLYAKFVSNDKPVHPMLADEMVVNGLIAVGAIIMVLAGARMLKLVTTRNKLRNRKDI